MAIVFPFRVRKKALKKMLSDAWVNTMCVDSRPYTSPMWMGIRGEVSEFTAVKETRNARSCCGGSGLEEKARRYVRRYGTDENAAAAELSLARCIRRIAQLFAQKVDATTQNQRG